jgi:predicted ribosome quality control (RQC) complex YloA/Tae2 family protein
MSLTQAQFKALVEEIAPQVVGSQLFAIWEWESRKFVLELEKEGIHIHLLLCFQEPFLRFHLFTGHFKKKQTPVNKKLETYVKGASLRLFEQVGQDRVLKIELSQKGQLHHILGEFFPKRPNLYLTQASGHILWSLNPVVSDLYQPATYNPNVLRQENNKILSNSEIEILYRDREREAAFIHEKQQLLKTIQKRLKRALQLREKSKQDLECCLDWSRVQHQGKLIQANLFHIQKGATSVQTGNKKGRWLKLILAWVWIPVNRRLSFSKKPKS